MVSGRQHLILICLLVGACGPLKQPSFTPDGGAGPAPLECASDLDCALGKQCTLGRCVEPTIDDAGRSDACQQDRDCGPGQQCVKSTGECLQVKSLDAGTTVAPPPPPPPPGCTPNDVVSCGSSKLGECRLGISTCTETNGVWAFGACVGAVDAAAELCDGKDNDCDGLVDNGFADLKCGVGACARTVSGCADGAPGVCTPGAPTAELCDGLDNNCDGAIDEGLPMLSCGVGACVRQVPSCTGGMPQTCTPGTPSTEACNGLDDDCNGTADDGLAALSCGVGACARTAAACLQGQPQTCVPGTPTPEQCNGIDDNCDGRTDEGCNCLNGATRPCYTGPAATQNVGACHGGTQTCVLGNWAACSGQVLPSAESCNGLDDDCNSSVDEGFAPLSCGAGACARTVAACVAGAPKTCSPGPAGVESCNGLDDDCDGVVDNGVCGPLTTCPAAKTVNPNTTVTLATTASSPTGRALTCAWSVVSRPATSNGTFTNGTNCTSASYFADVVGTHVVRFTVTDSMGLTSSCDVTLTVNPLGDLWVELTWSKNNDMDLHLLHSSAGNSHQANSWNTTWDCNWLNTNPSWDSAGSADDPSLDRDDITGKGPENVRINVPSSAHLYTVGVQMYSYTAPSAVTATVKVYCGGLLKTTLTKSFSKAKDLWVVGTVNFNGAGAAACTFTPDGYFFNVP